MTSIANTEPRHAAPSFLSLAAAQLHTLPQRGRAILRWIDRQLDKDMTGAGYVLCGAIMGLLFGPLLFFCYFG